MYNLFISDAHCDTASEMYNAFSPDSENLHMNLADAKKYKGYFQVFAVWSNPEIGKENLKKNFDRITDNFLSSKGEVSLVLSKEDLSKVFFDTSALLSVEGADILNGDINRINYLHEKGVRCITLTWNFSNAVGTAAADKISKNRGLTEFGKKVVEHLNKKHMIIDLSHADEKTFFDTVSLSAQPVCATHSNAYSLCKHPRNLTDEQIKLLIKTGGFMGINYYPPFLSENCVANISHIVSHIEHVLSLGGENIVGLGSDFDGIDCIANGINGAKDVFKIADALLLRNHSEKLVKKIMGENFVSYVKKVI